MTKFKLYEFEGCWQLCIDDYIFALSLAEAIALRNLLIVELILEEEE
jgi:hypothetical protein